MSEIHYWVGVDNGVSASIGIVSSDGKNSIVDVPTINVQDYTKAKKRINRIDSKVLEEMLAPFGKNVTVLLERPMINPKRFAASISAARAFEAEIVICERLGLRYIYVDSKEWQKELLPSGYDDTKEASKDVGCRLFPDHAKYIIKHKDADGLLMAEWARRHNL